MWINGKLKEHRDTAKEENRILCDRSMRIQTNPEPSKTIYPQTNKQTVYPIASKPLFYIKEADNKKAKAERWVAWEQRSWESCCHVKMSGWTFNKVQITWVIHVSKSQDLSGEIKRLFSVSTLNGTFLTFSMEFNTCDVFTAYMCDHELILLPMAPRVKVHHPLACSTKSQQQLLQRALYCKVKTLQ